MMQSSSQIALLTCSPGTDKIFFIHWKSQKCQQQLKLGRKTNQTTISMCSLKENANTSTSTLNIFEQ